MMTAIEIFNSLKEEAKLPIFLGFYMFNDGARKIAVALPFDGNDELKSLDKINEVLDEKKNVIWSFEQEFKDIIRDLKLEHMFEH